MADEVDDYLSAAALPRRVAPGRLRALGCEVLDGFEEVLEYGMPAYRRDGEVEFFFASEKRHVSVCVPRPDVMARHRDARPASTGKVCIRYASPAVRRGRAPRGPRGHRDDAGRALRSERPRPEGAVRHLA